MKIHIITTGGTIGGIDYDPMGKENINNPEKNIKSFLEIANVDFEYHIDDAFNKDSRFVNDKDRELLKNMVKSSKEDQILITHGTYTMEQTARYLGLLNLNKTIVLTGAFVLGFLKNTDAPFNLGYAIAALQFLGKGVYVAMHGKVFGWDDIYKNLEENRFMPLKH
ncbi:asparaginase domain-containing protein [Sinomicrobium sp. M5D2P17]